MRKPELGFFAQGNLPSPGSIFTMKLKLCYANGIDAVFFSESDLDKETLTINAWKWTQDGFQRETTALPHLLEYGAGTDLREFFNDKCTIIDDFNLSKKDINDLLIKTEFANSVIPSLYTTSPAKILSYLNLWNEVIIKPLAGARGEGIISIKQNSDGEYILTDADKEIGTFTYNECIDFLTKQYHNFTVIAQPRLKFRNTNGNTMDFRVNVSKNGKGEWTTIFISPRTARDKIISNYSQGAYASLLEITLEMDFGENSHKVLSDLNAIAEKLPPIVEEASACNMLSLGIDIGFDYDTLNPYIIEVNYSPKLTFPDKLKYHYVQSEYFAYIVRKFREGAL